MKHWSFYKVSELQNRGLLLVEDGNHGEYRPRPDEFDDGGTPFIRAADMSNGRILFDTAGTINEIALNRIRKGIGKPGDILFSHKGTVGKLAKVPLDAPPFVCSPQTTFWRVLKQEELDRDFLYSYMQSALFINQWKARAGETDMAGYVSLTAQRELTVPIPAIEEQKAIARILSSLDDKIELNRRMNATLEAMARALFKAWFVDCEPVHANLENRPSTSASPEIAKLFPSNFENGIPKGWKAGTVGENFNLTMGRSPSGDTYNKDGEGEVFYQGRTDFGFRFPTPRVYCTQPSTFAEKNDTLLSVRAPVGDINIAPNRCCIGRGIAAIKHKSGSRSFTYYNLWNLASHFDNFESEGTVFGSITKVGLQNTKIVEPIPQIIETFEETVGKLDDRIEANSQEIATLSQIRDSLLPRLISGKIRVGEFEEAVSQAQ